MSRFLLSLSSLATVFLVTSICVVASTRLAAEPAAQRTTEPAADSTADPATNPAETQEATKTKAVAASEAKPPRSLFNGKDLTNWKSTNFGGEGEVSVNAKDKSLILEMGSSLTGVTWTPAKGTAAIPTNNYEIELEARRVEGGDFFCGLTFPYKDSHASLILGGWGGGVVGISCIDYDDASENETTTYHAFKQDQWYKVRLKITENHVEAWINDKSFVDVDITGSKLGVRGEVELSRPLGFATFSTTAELRNIVLREITPPAEDEPE